MLKLIKKNNVKPKQTNINLTDKLEDLLQESLQKQLVSDAKLGMMLWGGVDSSLLVAMASRIESNLDTFTVIFQITKILMSKSMQN